MKEFSPRLLKLIKVEDDAAWVNFDGQYVLLKRPNAHIPLHYIAIADLCIEIPRKDRAKILKDRGM